MYQFKPFLILVAIFAVLSGCNKENKCYDATNPDCENYNPCFTQTKPSAKFIMEESNPELDNMGIWYADSVFFGAMIRFRSEYNKPEYKHTWYVGTDIFSEAITPDRNFLNVSRPQNITISHVLEYSPILSCFPDDVGKDSVAQTFRLIGSFNADFQTYGSFRGVLNNEVDSFDLQVLSVDKDGYLTTIDDNDGIYYVNFHKRGDTIASNNTAINWPLEIGAFLYNHHGVFTRGLEGTIEVDANGIMIMNYQMDGGNPIGDDLIPDNNWHTFKGRKIQ